MCSVGLRASFVVAVGCLAIASTTTSSANTGEAVKRAADSLVDSQTDRGDWYDVGYTGEPTAGLVHAFEVIPDLAYRTAAEIAGSAILDDSGYDGIKGTFALSPFATEAYALTRVADISPDDIWRQAATDLFAQISATSGAEVYLDDLISRDQPSFSVYDLARLAVAAHNVDGQERDVYRSKLIEVLPMISNASAAPVFALGMGVWGLASTGEMDDMALPVGSPELGGRTLAELPPLLAGFQDPEGDFAAFFSPPGAATGFTETTAAAALGLLASQARDPVTFDFTGEISAVISVLAGGVDMDGSVYNEVGVSLTGNEHFLVGQTLEVIPEPSSMVLFGVSLTVLAAPWRRVNKNSRIF